MFLLYGFVASLVAFYFLQGREDAKADRMGKPRSSLGAKIMLWFFLMLVLSILFYFVTNGVQSMWPWGGGKAGGDGDAVEMERPALEAMLQRIPEEMHTGLPPFRSMSLGD